MYANITFKDVSRVKAPKVKFKVHINQLRGSCSAAQTGEAQPRQHAVSHLEYPHDFLPHCHVVLPTIVLFLEVEAAKIYPPSHPGIKE